MGYHDLKPEAFVLSIAVQETNTAEDAALFDKWLKESAKKAKRLASGAGKQDDSEVVVPIEID